MSPTVDLHLHSTASDGTEPPAAVVRAARAAGLRVIALADHDTVAGVPEARAAAAEPEGTPAEARSASGAAASLRVIPALEISTAWKGEDLHLLGYFVDPGYPDLLGYAEVARGRRVARMERMIERLAGLGVSVSLGQVRAEASAGGNLGRPHLARALVGVGAVASLSDAFDRYIGNGGPAYVPSEAVEGPEAIALVRRAGGVAVWAHPPLRLVGDFLPELAEAGLDGIEVYRPGLPADRIRRLERYARARDLLVTGGSDWHGPGGGPLGEFRVEAGLVAAFLERGGIRLG